VILGVSNTFYFLFLNELVTIIFAPEFERAFADANNRVLVCIVVYGLTYVMGLK